jgi:hypothetical protein
VPVEEHLVFDNAVYPASSSTIFYKTATQLNTQGENASQLKPEPARLITQALSKELNSPLINAVVALSNEAARAGYGVLVFCSSRVGCEKDAMLISQVLPSAGEVDSSTAEKRRDLLSDLRSTTTGSDPILEKTIPVGVAFHRESDQEQAKFISDRFRRCWFDHRRKGRDCDCVRSRSHKSHCGNVQPSSRHKLTRKARNPSWSPHGCRVSRPFNVVSALRATNNDLLND